MTYVRKQDLKCSLGQHVLTVCYSATHTAALWKRTARSHCWSGHMVLCSCPLRELGSVQFSPLLHGLGTKLLCLSAALVAPAPIHSLGSRVWILGVVLCDVCDSDGIISTSINQLRLPFPERPMAGQHVMDLYVMGQRKILSCISMLTC